LNSGKVTLYFLDPDNLFFDILSQIERMLAEFSINAEMRGYIKRYVDFHHIESEHLDRILGMTFKDGRMPITLWWDALAHLSSSQAHPCIGIALGQLTQTNFFGALGYLVETSKDVHTALLHFHQYERFLYEGASSVFSQSDSTTELYWPMDYGYSTQESDETLISGLVSTLRTITGMPTLSPVSIGFVHSKPRETQLYDTLFNCDIAFSAPNTRIVFANDAASLPLLKSDPALNCILKESVAQQVARLPAADRFLRWFYQHLNAAIQGRCASIDILAQRMSISPRTLSRKLHERGLSFNTERLSVQKHRAKHMLIDNQLSLSEIALALGYSEQSAFNRAFKKWYGMTPRQFKNAQLSD